MAKLVKSPKRIAVKSKAPAKAKTATKSVAPAPKQATRAKVSARVEHTLSAIYSGASPVVTRNRSKTPLVVAEFGKNKDLVLTERDNVLFSSLKKAHGNREFVRGNADAGILNRFIRKGVLRHVSGDPASEAATLRFV